MGLSGIVKPAVASLAIVLTGCASQQPVVYPNDNGGSGEASVQAAIDECIDLADTNGADDRNVNDVAARTARNTAIGAGTGAVVGAIRGRAGRGAAIGAATTGVGTLLRSAFKSSKPDATHRRFVNQCLKNKGYKVVGWS